jgi:hypothetical protein
MLLSRHILSICLLVALPYVANAQPSADARVIERWIAQAWDASTHVPNLGAGFAFRIEYHLVPPDDELEQLRAEVPDKPEHPRAAELAQYEERLRGHPSTQKFAVFLASDDRWRCNQEIADTWIDAAVNGPLGWKLQAEALSIYPMNAAGQREAGDPRGTRNVFAATLSKLTDGGFGQAARGGLIPGPVSVKGDRWSFRAISKGDRDGAPTQQIAFEGHWDQSLDRGFVDRMTFLEEHPVRDAFGNIVSFVSWHKDEQLGIWVAARAESHFPDGRLDAKWILEDPIPFGPGGIEALLELPKPNGTDPRRGQVAFRSIFDFRDRSVSNVESAKITRVGSIEHTASEKEIRNRWLRPAGWVLVAIAIAWFLRLRSGTLRT